METSLPYAYRDAPEVTANKRRGGWITFPFISVTMAGLTLAAGGWMNNLQVYMIKEFHVKSIDSAQISNIVSGCTSMLPVLAAIIADSYLGCFTVILMSSLFSLMGIFLLMLTSTVDSLRPPKCESATITCLPPSKQQFALLYTAIVLAVLGVSGTRFLLGTMGANQYGNTKHQAMFWNWFIFTLYVSLATSATLVVYIEDNVGWGLGFGLCLVANVVAFIIFFLGRRFYKHLAPKGSPFVGLACVVIAAVRKRNLLLSGASEENYYFGKIDDIAGVVIATPTKSFKFFNRAALKTEGDFRADGSITRVWKICSVQQVEDLKTLIKLLPLWSTGIFLVAPLAIQVGLTILQALRMDRQLGQGFKLSPGSMIVFLLASTAISVSIFDRIMSPAWKRLTARSLNPLQRFGIGHVMTILSMVVSALVELKRLKTVKATYHEGTNTPISVLWLVPQLVISGIGEAFHVPGSTEFFYHEFPVSLKNTSTSMTSLFVGIAFYVSTAVIGLIRSTTSWLPDNINDGRMDKVFWVLSFIGVVNFGYYFVCARFYKYQGVEKVAVDEGLSI